MSRVTMLTNADIRKVDLVPAGAQQLSRIEIMKGGQAAMNEKIAKLSDEELNEIQSLLDEIKAKLEITDEDADDKEKTDDVETKDCEKVEDAVKDNSENNVTPDDTDSDGEHKKVEGEGETKGGVTEGCVTPDEPEEVKEALKKAADTQAENDKLKDQIAKMQDEKVTKMFINKASELGNIPGISTEDLGNILKVISKSVDTDTYDKVEAVLKSANDAIGTGSMFVEKGTSAQGSGEPTSADEAWHLIEKMAESRVAKGLSNTGNCVSDVLDTPEGASLYLKYKALRGGN